MRKAEIARTFVLVPGAGHGGWVWRRVRDLLTAQGHRVFTPTLTGVGDRSHLLSADITLQTHVDDVVNLFLWEDLADVVLVGHSYAGWVVTQAVERLENRVFALVYLDAFLPDNGQRGVDFLNESRKAAFHKAQAEGAIARPGSTSADLRIQAPEDAAWVDSKITPHPIGVSPQPLELTGSRDRVPVKVYVRAPLFPQSHFDDALERCRADASWKTVVMENCGHDPMVDDPEGVVAILDDLG